MVDSQIWLILIVVGVILEAVSPQLVAIWFVFGFVAALVANLLGAGATVQIIVAIVVAVGCLIATKPLVKKIMTQEDVNTNADRYIGKTAIVTTEIKGDNTGRVEVSGSNWSAFCKEDITIEVGTKVVVEKIEGVKFLVKVLEV
ncbi:MAG: NfeD family protein [Clostridia bacterium]